VQTNKIGNKLKISNLEKILDADLLVNFLNKEVTKRQNLLVKYYGIQGNESFIKEAYGNPVEFGLTCDAFKVYSAYHQRI